MDITPAIGDYLSKRLSVLDKLVSGKVYMCDVELGKTTRHHKSGDFFKAEVNMTLEGKHLFSVVEREDLYAAIDEVKDEIERQIVTDKKKTQTVFKRGAQKVKNILKGITPWRSS